MRDADTTKVTVDLAAEKLKSILRDDFIISMNKFLSTMQRTIVQLEGEVRLQVPDLPELTDNDEQNLRNAELLDKIEVIVQGTRSSPSLTAHVLCTSVQYCERNCLLAHCCSVIFRKCYAIGWERQVTKALDELLARAPQGNGPLAEIDFWRERNAALSALIEQFKLPNVRHILSIYSQSIGSTSEYQHADLVKYYVEAKDNVRFGSVLPTPYFLGCCSFL